MKYVSILKNITATTTTIFTIIGKVAVYRAMNKKLIFIMGTPMHSNIGDLAIAEAENSFLSRYIPESIAIDIPASGEHSMSLLIHLIQKIANANDVFALHGGGNMGDVYHYEEYSRREAIQTFPSNTIIMFPQTMHFSKTRSGHAALSETARIYSSHKNLTLVAREHNSYKQMVKYFAGNVVTMIPDVVLSMTTDLKEKTRTGILLCLRSDIERNLSSKDAKVIYATARRASKNVRYTDMITGRSTVFSFLRKRIVNSKLKEFSSAKLVITDRLHGMVFAAITGTPCIVLANYNHKVAGVYNWLKDLEYIEYCNNPEALEEHIIVLISIKYIGMIQPCFRATGSNSRHYSTIGS